MFELTRSFTHEEWMEYKKNKNREREILATLLGIAMFLNPVKASAAMDYAKIDSLGGKFLSLARAGGYWIIVIVATIDIIKSAMRGGKNQIGSTVVKYILIYTSMYLLPELFDLIRGVFS